MRAPQEFHYRLPTRVRGHRPGSHPGLAIGAGQEFVSHVSLYERADPRRLDLRASLRSLRQEWLVRVNRQRAGVAVHAVVDVSASMRFGAGSKRQMVGDFLESLGLSAFRAGDLLGMLAFDTREREELFLPPRIGRGSGSLLRQRLEEFWDAEGGAEKGDDAAQGLELAAKRLAGRDGLVFIVSDFHWPLERLSAALDLLAHSTVVPLIVWDRAEMEPPASNGFALLRDSESGAPRTLWLRPSLRVRWHEAVAHRREQLERVFAAHFIRPLYLQGSFDAEVMSKYFLEGVQ
ncbi:MAG TPA: VWA domain-containing protein [Steroidobacteraceae bacterium]|nr:VWA domain-containing protein [Steroidobacteraceae bacterium]